MTVLRGTDERETERSTPAGAPKAEKPHRAVDIFGTITGLFLLAAAQPILDLLAHNGTFFIARHSPALDLILLAVGVTMFLPLALSGLIVLGAKLNKNVGRTLFLAISALLGTFVVLRMVNVTFPQLGASAFVLLPAAAIGAGISWGVSRSQSWRSILRWSPVLAAGVAVWFVALSPLSQITFAKDVASAPAGTIGRTADVVMLVLDELPLATLLDRSRQVDDKLFPNLARFAADSNWYRNATTVSDNTVRAIPAILDGNYPEKELLPTAADHPHNVFTLLGSDYEVKAEEVVTRLCPGRICEEELPALGPRMSALFSDVGLISAHALLPGDFTRDLPPVDENWDDFAAPGAPLDVAGVPGARNLVGAGDRLAEMRAFVDGIRPLDEPVFYFNHVLLPHTPWRYLPGGYEYPQTFPIPGTIPLQGSPGTRWGEDRWLAAQGYQRHILQSMAVDEVLGALLHRLEEVDLYEESMVIVVSDHGTSFQAGSRRRSTSAETVGEVAPIAMFIKQPGQTKGKVIDLPVQTIDILPTIASILEAEDVGVQMDGSVLTRPSQGTKGRRLGFGGNSTPYSDEGTELLEVVQRKYEIFGPAPFDPYLLAPPGMRFLFGQQAPEDARPSGLSAEIEEAESYSEVDLSGDTLPAMIRGRIEGEVDPQRKLTLAVALNGTIAAVTQAYEGAEGDPAFQAIIPPALFQNGRNLVQLFQVNGQSGRAVLRSLAQE